jgi:acetyl-CoA carboxylase biotin carboxyl carrier protein
VATPDPSMIDLRYVKKLIELLDGSSVDSIEISSDKGMKIRLSKSPSQRGTVQVAAPVPMPLLAAGGGGGGGGMAPARLTPSEGVVALPESAPSDGKAESAKSKWIEIKSPMVGTFYSAPEPGAKAYVTEGQRIQRGQMVCIIEAMKIMNEIESEFAGVVKEVLVQDAHPVEYGQVLFRIEPNG